MAGWEMEAALVASLLWFRADPPINHSCGPTSVAEEEKKKLSVIGTTSTGTVGRGLGLGVLLIFSWKVLDRGIAVESPGILLGILDNANLIFHEAGHVFLTPLGEFMHYLGGSLFQVVIPAICSVYFWLHKQPASCAVTTFWTGESLTNVAIYVADARRMELPLIGGNHDWNYLLSRLNLLNQAETLGRLIFIVGALTIFFGLGLLLVDFFRSWNRASADN